MLIRPSSPSTTIGSQAAVRLPDQALVSPMGVTLCSAFEPGRIG